MKKCFWIVLLLALSACGTPAAQPTPVAAPAATSVPTVAATTAPTAVPTTAATMAPTIAATAAPSGASVTDSAGNTLTLGSIPQRIVSLAPSTTEIAFAVGAGSRVVGVDAFSDYPAEAKALEKVSGPDGKYNLEQIVALKPDLVLAAGITSAETITKLKELGINVAVIGSAATTIDSILGDIELVGKLTGQEQQALQITADMRKRIDAVKATAAKATSKPKVYWELDATDPAKPFSVGPGNFINNIIELVGGENIFASASSPFVQVSSEQIVAANPDLIVLSDAAYGITPESVTQRPGWQALAAVKNNRVLPIDDNLVSRPGPRIVDGIEAALKLIQPTLAP